MKRHNTFRTEAEVASALDLPVLTVVPEMRVGAERRPHRRRRLTWFLLALIAILAAWALVWATLGQA